MSNKHYIIITVFLLAACISTWLLLQALQNQPVQQNQPTHPDAYMLGAIGTRMNTDGNPQDELLSPSMVHYSAGDKTDIASPHVIIFHTKNTPWNITANYGQAQNGIETILLWDHVKLWQLAGPNNHAITMTTTTLTIYPKPQTAQTQAPVTIWELGSIVHAVGLHADLKSGTIDLLSQTRGEFQPNQK